MYLKYLLYVVKHKWFVFIECAKLRHPLLGILHDWSKFRPSEFIPYARYFYGEYPSVKEIYGDARFHISLFQEDIEQRFDKAWLLHIHRNKHHWQYWILQEDDGPKKLIPIPPKYLLEMIADWRGAGKAINGKDNTLEWYEQNKDIIQLRKINRIFVEQNLHY